MLKHSPNHGTLYDEDDDDDNDDELKCQSCMTLLIAAMQSSASSLNKWTRVFNVFSRSSAIRLVDSFCFFISSTLQAHANGLLPELNVSI